MLENAQQYLAKVVAWPQEGDTLPSYINIHWSIDKLNEKTGKPIFTGRAVRSVQEAINTVAWALKSADTKDIYVCMSSQAESLEKVSKRGHKYLAPIRSQEGVVALKSLFIDLDAKGENANSYGSIQDAAAALGAFIKVMDLPPASAVVTSGGGLHVYWSFERALTRAEWQPLAYALAEATKKHGLKCDTQCTIDSARILRIPDTFNHKLDAPRPVALAGSRVGYDYAVERLDRVLEPYKTATPAIEQSVLPRRPPLQGESELSMGIDRTSSQPVDLNSVLSSCAFLNDAVTSGGKDNPNPLWNLTTLISCFTQQGRADAHRMALSHPGYSKESTDDLFDRKERERQTKGLGWPSCRTISASGASQCAACPHFAAGKSPLNLAVKPAAIAAPSANNRSGVAGLGGAVAGSVAVPIIGLDLPAGYKRQGSGIVCRVVINADGSSQDEPICSYPMTKPWLQPEPDWVLNFTTTTQVGHSSQVALPLKEIATKDRLRTALLTKGITLRENESKHAQEFFMSWIQTLQQKKEAVISSSPFGWSQLANGNVDGFVYGGHKFTASGATGASNPDPVLARQYRPIGDRAHWIKAAKLITDQRRPQLDAILASAFAAPLVKFTSEPGVVMSVYSQESGIGKTTALKVAQAVWGDPIRAMQGLSDTENAVIRKMGQLASLPVYWDELKSEEDHKKFVKLVFELTRRREKARLQQTTAFRESGDWQTMLVSASNASIMDYVTAHAKQTLAGVYRTFEFEVTPGTSQGKINQADASKIVGKLEHNFGNIGLEYAEFIGKNHAMIEQQVEDFYKKVGDEMKVENEERFWRVMVATLLQGAAYANALQFTEIDLKALKKFLIDVVVAGMREQKKSTSVDMRNQLNVSVILAQFLNQMRARHTLVTNIIHRVPGKPKHGSVEVKRDASRLEATYIHVGLDDKIMRISQHYFAQWLEKEGYSRFMYAKSLVDQFGAKEVIGRMGGGTQYAVSTERLIEIDLANNPIANFLDEV